MTFGPFFGTGFEMGDDPITSAYITYDGFEAGISGVISGGHTGNYQLRIRASTTFDFQVGGSQGELYITVWCKPHYARASALVRVELTDGNVIGLRYDHNNHTWDAYVAGAQVASGSIVVSNQWTHIQLYVRIGNSGAIQSKIDGTDDIDYSGDTAPGASSTIEFVTLGSPGDADQTFFDDFVFGDDGWPGDMRFDPLLAVGDTVTEDWDLSAGADSYALLDEVPPSDADYIYSTVNGEQTIVELDSWDATDKTPEFVMLWARAKKDVAAAHQLKLINDDGVNTEVGSAQDLLTSYSYLYELLRSAPDGFQWNDTKIDSLNLGVESVVV